MAKKTRAEVVEFEPDAWQRFERAVKVVAKSPPQPNKKKPKLRKRKGKKATEI